VGGRHRALAALFLEKGVGGQHHALAALFLEKTQYPLYRRLRYSVEHGKNKHSLNCATVKNSTVVLCVASVNVSLRPGIRIFFNKIMDAN
jgi:hypothetical protein